MARKPRRPILASFVDCTSVMQQALDHGGVRVDCGTRGKAFRFRQRCYQARKMLAVAAEASAPPGVVPSTQFDDVFIRLESEAKPGGDEGALLFELHTNQKRPRVTGLDGRPLDVVEEPEWDDDIDLGDLE